MFVSHHFSVFSTQVLQFLLHALKCLLEIVVLLGQSLVLLKHGLHLALCLTNSLQLNRGRK